MLLFDIDTQVQLVLELYDTLGPFQCVILGRFLFTLIFTSFNLVAHVFKGWTLLTGLVNVLRLVSACLDLLVLSALFVTHLWNAVSFAAQYSIGGLLCLFCLMAFNWTALAMMRRWALCL